MTDTVETTPADLDTPAPPRVRLWRRVARWIDNRLNPILVRDVRQSMRSRSLVVLFLLVLAGMVLLMLFAADGSAARTGPYGEDTFGPAVFETMQAWMPAVFVVLLPAIVGFRTIMATSRDRLMMKMVPVGPGSLVMGRWLSAMVVAMLVMSVAGPVLWLSWFMRGVDPLAIGLLLAAVTARTALFMMSVILIAHMPLHLIWRLAILGAWIVLFGFWAAWGILAKLDVVSGMGIEAWVTAMNYVRVSGVLSAISGLTGVVPPVVASSLADISRLAPDKLELLGNLAGIEGPLLNIGLLFLVARGMAKPAGSDRAFGPRLYMALLLPAALAWLGLAPLLAPGNPEYMMVFVGFTVPLAFYMVVLFGVSEGSAPPRRMEAAARRWGLLRRLMHLVLSSGQGSAMLFFAVLSGVCLVVLYVTHLFAVGVAGDHTAWALHTGTNRWGLPDIRAVLLYLSAVGLLSMWLRRCVLWRWVPGRYTWTIVVGVTIVVIAVCWQFGIRLLAFDPRPGRPLWSGGIGKDGWITLAVLAVLTVVGVILNYRVLAQPFRTYFARRHQDPQAQPTPDTKGAAT